MAAFKSTCVVIPRADQTITVLRFLSTSERYLLRAATSASSHVFVRTALRTHARTAQ